MLRLPIPAIRSRANLCGGFSYVELLITMALVMIAYSLYFGPGSSGVQDRKKADCLRRLEQISLAMNVYAGEHNGAYPAVQGALSPGEPLSLLVPAYASDVSVFICPGSRDAALPQGKPFAGRRISYAYYMGYRTVPAAPLLAPGLLPQAGESSPLLSDAQIDALPKRQGKPVFAAADRAPGNNHRKYGGNILFGDGHAERAEPDAPRDLPIPPGVALLNP